MITLGLGSAAFIACGGVEERADTATDESALYRDIPMKSSAPWARTKKAGFPSPGHGVEYTITVQTCTRRHNNCVRNAEAA